MQLRHDTLWLKRDMNNMLKGRLVPSSNMLGDHLQYKAVYALVVRTSPLLLSVG